MNRPFWSKPKPTPNCSHSNFETEEASEKPEVNGAALGKKRIVRRKPKVDRSNGVFTKVLEGEESFRRKERILALELKCGLRSDQETAFHGIFHHRTIPSEIVRIRREEEVENED
jgi:hypothetical protein